MGNNNKITENDFSKEESDENFVSPSMKPHERPATEITKPVKGRPNSQNVSIRDETAAQDIFKETVPPSAHISKPVSMPVSKREKDGNIDSSGAEMPINVPIMSIEKPSGLVAGNKVVPTP